MKTGQTREQFAQELIRQSETKSDFRCPTSDMLMVKGDDGSPALELQTQGRYGMTDYAHTQLATYTGIPRRYYTRMRDENRDLLATNVNTWLSAAGDRRLVRTLDGDVRALLSNRYRVVDNWEIASVALDELSADMRIESCELTPRRMYIKIVNPRLEGEIVRGDVVQSGLVLSNSEVGAGSVQVEPFLYRLVCLNGMIAPTALRRKHVGRAWDVDDGVLHALRDETLRADERAFMLKVRDVIRAAFDELAFRMLLEQARETVGKPIDGDPVKAVESLANTFDLTDDERGGVLRRLFEDGDLSQWGMVNAVTRHSQDVADYERATELERMGGQLAALPAARWNRISSGSVTKRARRSESDVDYEDAVLV